MHKDPIIAHLMKSRTGRENAFGLSVCWASKKCSVVYYGHPGDKCNAEWWMDSFTGSFPMQIIQ